MPTTITVSLRGLAATATVVAALVASYSVGSANADAPEPEPASTADAAPDGSSGIFVQGTGSVTGVPDQLRFSLSSHATASDVSGALAQASAATRRVLAALADQGLPREDVQTTGMSLRPVLDYGGGGPPLITGYAASQALSVLVRDLPKAGEALAAAVEAGGNAVRLGGVNLQIAHPHALLHRARERAFAEARAKAEQYARASGRGLGPVMSVREGTARRPLAFASTALRLESARDLATVPVRRGSEQVTVSVSLVWAFA